MYRSVYGNEFLFFVGGLAGSITVVLFFKLVPVFSFLSYLGRHTIVLLATHIRMLTLIKIVAFFIFGVTVFNFTEVEKLALSFVQVIMVIPIIWLVTKYVPILDGKIKKS
jgi:fucose 4-O-acetylase-like acetyltransferase